MWLILVGLFIARLIPIVIGVIRIILRRKLSNRDRFECGFDSFNVRVFPISIRFFIFCLIFLILDLELIIITLIPIVIWRSGFILNLVFFLRLVTLRILGEWLFGRLRWVE